MKNQYVADIGDYGKYALLKAFTDAGVNLGINWYLTPDDKTNDGKFTKYLQEDKKNIRRFAPEVYDALQKIYTKDRTVTGVERSGVLNGAVYFRERVKTAQDRSSWFDQSEQELAGAQLIFLDPDNGLKASGSYTGKGTEKYVLPWEVIRYFEHSNVVYYCHKGRRTQKQWEAYKAKMFMELPSAQPIILTYHKGTQRSYVFLVHPMDHIRYKEITDRVVERWEGAFTEEFIQDPYLQERHLFAIKWSNIFQKNYDFHTIFDNMEFSVDARKAMLVMDAEHSFHEAFPEVGYLGDPKKLTGVMNDKKMTPRLLGAAIHSYWRYFNHWADAHPSRDEVEWFILALNRLAELTE